MMAELFKENEDTFIWNWLFLNWQVFNFTDVDAYKAFNREPTNIQPLIKAACLYSNEYFVREIFENVSNIADVSIEGNSLLHLVCKSKIKPTDKAKYIISQRSDMIFRLNNSDYCHCTLLFSMKT